MEGQQTPCLGQHITICNLLFFGLKVPPPNPRIANVVVHNLQLPAFFSDQKYYFLKFHDLFGSFVAGVPVFRSSRKSEAGLPLSCAVPGNPWSWKPVPARCSEDHHRAAFFIWHCSSFLWSNRTHPPPPVFNQQMKVSLLAISSSYQKSPSKSFSFSKHLLCCRGYKEGSV